MPRRSSSPRTTPFAKWLTRARESKNLTMERLAEVSGLSQGYISVLEASKKTPARKTIIALAEAMGVEAADGLRAAGFLPGDSDLIEADNLIGVRDLLYRDLDDLARTYLEWQSVLNEIADENARMQASADRLKELQEREAVLRERLRLPSDTQRRLSLITAELHEDENTMKDDEQS